MALLLSVLVHFCEKCWSRLITLIVWPCKGSSLSRGKVWHCELLPAWYLSPYSHTSLLSSVLVDFPLGGLIRVGGKRATGVVFKAVLNVGLVLILLLLRFGQWVQSTSLGWFLSSSPASNHLGSHLSSRTCAHKAGLSVELKRGGIIKAFLSFLNKTGLRWVCLLLEAPSICQGPIMYQAPFG